MEFSADVIVVGGGMGGVAAAYAVARSGRSVILTEETDWLGGQLTQQGVPPDEHRWIERFGRTRSYRTLRDRIRAHYRHYYPLSESALRQQWLNPGDGIVSSLCCEPRVALAAIDTMLLPYISCARIRILLNHRPVQAEVDGDWVRSVTVEDPGGERSTLSASFIIDATETGTLLPLTKAEYVSGFESQDETGEPHAPAQGQPLNMQAVSVCFAIDHLDGEDHTIDKPANYEYWRSHRPTVWPGPQLGWWTPDPRTLLPFEHVLRPNPGPLSRPLPDGESQPHSQDVWLYRRIVARHQFHVGTYASDITLVNWPMIDYVGGSIIEVDDQTAQRHLDAARELSLSFLYWMQTEAPRPDDGHGYPGLRLRDDVLGTSDGLAKHPYVRESRRIRAQHTVVEQEIVADTAQDGGIARYDDTVGVGCYRIDLHPSTGGDSFIDLASRPFEIPLGALLPVRLRNLLPGAKNIGTTHITNGCFRLHPVEWNIGEAAGLLSAYCLDHGCEPHQVRHDDQRLRQFQAFLTRAGVELHWP